jgi:hypothetical protein
MEFSYNPMLREFGMDELDKQLKFKRTVSFQIRDDLLLLCIAPQEVLSERIYTFYEKVQKISLLDIHSDSFNTFEISISEGIYFYRTSSASLKLEFFNIIQLLARYYTLHEDSQERMVDAPLVQWLESISFYEQRVYELFEDVTNRMLHLEEITKNMKRLSTSYESMKDHLEPYYEIGDVRSTDLADVKKKLMLDEKIGQLDQMVSQMASELISKDDSIETLKTLLTLFQAKSQQVTYWRNIMKCKSHFWGGSDKRALRCLFFLMLVLLLLAIAFILAICLKSEYLIY